MSAEILAALITIGATIVLGLIGFFAKAVYGTLKESIKMIQIKIDEMINALKPIGEKQAQQIVINDDTGKTLDNINETLDEHSEKLDNHEHRITKIESQHVINHKVN